MNVFLQILLFGLMAMGTVTPLENPLDDENEYIDPPGCLTEIVFKNISLNNTKAIKKGIQDHLTDMDLANKDNLNETNIKLDRLTADSKEMLNVLKATNKNITYNIKELQDSHGTSITQVMSGIRNTDDIIKDMHKNLSHNSDLNQISSDIEKLIKLQKEEMLLNISNDISLLEALIKNINSSLNTFKIELQTNLSGKHSEVMKSSSEIKELVQGNGKTAGTAEQHSTKQIKCTFNKTDIFGIICTVASVVIFVLICVLLKHIRTMQLKLQHIQTQMTHERYYKRDSSVTGLKLPKYEEEQNGGVRANPKINMYEATELTENLMTKNET